MSINLSRKSLTEATLRRMMGWRGAIHCSFPWPSWRPRFPTLCKACKHEEAISTQHSHLLHIRPAVTDRTQCEWLRVSKSEIKRVPEAKHAVRPFVQPTPGPQRGGSPPLHPSLKLSFEPQSGRNTRRGKNSLLPFSVAGPWQQHFSTTDSNHRSHVWRFTFLLTWDHISHVFTTSFTAGHHFYSKVWGNPLVKLSDAFLAIYKADGW